MTLWWSLLEFFIGYVLVCAATLWLASKILP